MKFFISLCEFFLFVFACLSFVIYQVSAEQVIASTNSYGQNKEIFFVNNRQTIDSPTKGYKEGGVSPKCMTHLKNFSNATSIFINCAVTNGRPLHYCKNCVDEYLTVKEKFGLIVNDTSQTEHNCKEQILRADTIELALLTYQFVESIWGASNCDRCFNITYVNNTVFYSLSDMTETLFKKINLTLDCFQDFSSLVSNDTSFNASVCDNCNILYSEANDYYEFVEDSKRLCSDLIDSMNYTRLAWAGDYDCTIAEMDKGLVWVITGIVCVLPVILYLGIIFYDRRFGILNDSRGFQEAAT